MKANPWRTGLLISVVLGSLGGWLWMILVAGHDLQMRLFLLAGVFITATIIGYYHYRRKLTPELMTSSVTFGSLIHLVFAAVLVGADRLWQLGFLPAIASNWLYFLIGTVGIGAAFFSWTWARGTPEPAELPSIDDEPEPAPPSTPVLEVEPDWDGLLESMVQRKDAVRARNLQALRRISTLMQGDEPVEERLKAALLALRQEALRLTAESSAEERDGREEDMLSQAAALLEWGAQKLPELSELDVGDVLMGKAIADIRSQKSEVRRVFVDHKALAAIHPIDRDTANEKCDERAEAARAALPVIEANGMRLSEDLIASHPELDAFKSVTGFQVLSMGDGKYITFEGNGRREALRRAFGDEGVLVEVREFVFENPATLATMRRRVNRVREWKDLPPVV